MANHDLDGLQVLKEIYDPATNSIKTVPSNATSFAVELSYADGDSVLAIPNSNAIKVTITPSTPLGELSVTDLAAHSKYRVYMIPDGALSTAAHVHMDISPSDTDNVWLESNSTHTSSLLASTMNASSLQEPLARRLKLRLVTAPVGANVQLYLVKA